MVVRRSGVRAGLLELVLVAFLYVAYTGSRVLADDHVAPALGRARRLLGFEHRTGLSWEHRVNHIFVDHGALGLFGSYWYSTAHYLVTAGVLLWLWRRGRDVYLPARRALVVATVLGLVVYLLMPTAPPRMLGGYADVLALHARDGWWGSDASAPRGLGGMTNELAAFPSLHAGWSLWVALTVRSTVRSRLVQAVAVAYAATTALVVVGTANHWVVDVLVGWLVALVGWAVATAVAPLVTACRMRRLARQVASASARLTTEHGLKPLAAAEKPSWDA